MKKLGLVAAAFAFLALGLVRLQFAAGAGPHNDPVRLEMLEAARRAFNAYSAEYDTGKADLDTLYVWSRRWMDAQRLGQRNDEAVRADADHLARMIKLHGRVDALHRVGGVGGEEATLRAAEFYVAEAKALLSQQ
jgi:hypothetical protein